MEMGMQYFPQHLEIGGKGMIIREKQKKRT